MPRAKKQKATRTLPTSKSKPARQAEDAPKKQDLLADLKRSTRMLVIIKNNLYGVYDNLEKLEKQEKERKKASYQKQKEAFYKEKEKWKPYLSPLISNCLSSEEIKPLFEAVRDALLYLVKIELILCQTDDVDATFDVGATFTELEAVLPGRFEDTSLAYLEDLLTVKVALYFSLARKAFKDKDMNSCIVFLLSIPPKSKWLLFSAEELERVYEHLLNLFSVNPNLILVNKVDADFLETFADSLRDDEFYYDLKSPSAPKLEMSFAQAVQYLQENIISVAFSFVSEYAAEVKTNADRYCILLTVKAGLRAMRDCLESSSPKVSPDALLQSEKRSRKIRRLFLETNQRMCKGFLLEPQKQKESNSLKTNRDDEKKEEVSPVKANRDNEKGEVSSVEINRDDEKEEVSPVETNINNEKNSELITNRIEADRRDREKLGKLCLDLAKIRQSCKRFIPEKDDVFFLNLVLSFRCQNKEAEFMLYDHLEKYPYDEYRGYIEVVKKKSSSDAKYFQAVELMQRDQRELDSKIEELLLDSANQEFFLAYIKLGEFYFRQGKVELSEKYYRKAEDLGLEDINIRIAHSIYFTNHDESKECKVVSILENAKDSGSCYAAAVLIYYNLSKILPVSSISPYYFEIRSRQDRPHPTVDLLLQQEHTLRSLGLCMEAYVLDVNQEITEKLHIITLLLFNLSVLTIFKIEILEKIKSQIKNLFLRFPLLADKYVAKLEEILQEYKEKYAPLFESIQAQDNGENDTKSRMEKTDPLVVQSTLDAISESVISFGETVLKETGSVKGHISMLVLQMKTILRSIFYHEQYVHARYKRKRESLKKLFLELNDRIEGVVGEIGLYDLKSIIEILTKLRINNNTPIFKSCFSHLEKIMSARVAPLDLSNDLSLAVLIIRCLYSLCFLKETEVKKTILNVLIPHLKDNLKSLSFDLISKFFHTIAVAIANHKKVYGEDSILPDILVKAVCLLQDPAVGEKLKKAQNEAHLHQFILATKFIALYLPDEMKPLINCSHYQKQACSVQTKVQKGQPSHMQWRIGLWLKEGQYDIQHEYIIGILPADIYASYPRGAAHPTTVIVECNGYHHYYYNNLDEEFKADKLEALSEEDFESVHDSILESTPGDIFKLAYKEKEGGVPIVCISIPMYMRGKEYVMRYIQRKIAPLCEKDLPQPLLGMTKMRLFAPPLPPTEDLLPAEEKQLGGCSMFPRLSHDQTS